MTETPLIPVRMLNEFVYCPRLGYMMWAQGEFAHNEFTVDGKIQHKRVDQKSKAGLEEKPKEDTTIHARSVSLGSEVLGITAKIDLVESDGTVVSPVDYKRGKRPHVESGVHDPERVQLCAQGLLLREHGFMCNEGNIYFVASRERVPVSFDEELMELTLGAIQQFKAAVSGEEIPPPLEDSPKCPHCSLIGICLPDEVRLLSQAMGVPRPVIPRDEKGLPLYVQSPRAYVCKDGECLVIEVEKEKVSEARLAETSQVVLYGAAMLSTPALHECLRREIPVTYLSYGGWFLGHTVGVGHHNVETRTRQYRASFDEQVCLRLARRLIAAKIVNCRTLMRRNWREGEGKTPPGLLADLQYGVKQAMRAAAAEALLGIEGAAAGLYFQNFSNMLKTWDDTSLNFRFADRNRRPPLDPVNAMLSFAYSMLTRELTVTLSAVGLDPYRGFYHKPRFGRPALALDMM